MTMMMMKQTIYNANGDDHNSFNHYFAVLVFVLKCGYGQSATVLLTGTDGRARNMFNVLDDAEDAAESPR